MNLDIESYLKHFGYMPALTSLAQAYLAFRRAHGIPDSATAEAVESTMRLPRCGLPDHALTTAENRWRKRDLKVYVESYVTALSRGDQDDLLDGCLKVWPSVCNLTMQRVLTRSIADVVIGAGRGRSSGFDGPQGVLAWAELPPGDDRQLRLMLDLDERWISTATQAGILYKNVVNHELGHIVGLDHSRGLMAPYYAAGIAVPQQDDDIPRAQALYGAPVNPPAPTSQRIVLEFQGPIPGFTVRRE